MGQLPGGLFLSERLDPLSFAKKRRGAWSSGKYTGRTKVNR